MAGAWKVADGREESQASYGTLSHLTAPYSYMNYRDENKSTMFWLVYRNQYQHEEHFFPQLIMVVYLTEQVRNHLRMQCWMQNTGSYSNISLKTQSP